LLDDGFKGTLSNCYEKSICSDEAVQRKEGINYGKFNYKRTYKVICHYGNLNLDKNIKSIFKVYFQSAISG